MEHTIFVILATAALFLAIILQLAAKPKFAAKITGAFMVIAAVSGICIYGYGFSSSISNPLLATMRALFTVCKMFVGAPDFSAVSGTPIFQNQWAQLYFYLVHFFALYATASAAITTVGGEALQKLRLWFARRGELSLIYGINPESLDFGKQLLAEKKSSVLFVDKAPDPGSITAIIKAGGAVRSDDNALQANEKFLKAIGLRSGGRKVTLYTLHSDSTDNLPYAKAFLQSLEAAGIDPTRTGLVMPAKEETAVAALQISPGQYGYGFVTCFRPASLAARMLTKLYPPCNSIEFDQHGRAKEDFNALLIGFGQTGQEILRQLVMQSQFVGSTFHADVFAPDCLKGKGYFRHSYETMLSTYEIEFYDYDARSKQFYDYIRSNRRKLDYVVVATGSQMNNREIAEDLSMFFHNLGMELPIYLVSHQNILCCNPNGSFSKPFKIYQPKVISTQHLDCMAMVLNHYYQGDTTRTPLEHWMDCDYFSRMSCRAATDFVPAILRAAGTTEEAATAGLWQPDEALLEVLGQMEHLRWNAFHLAMGFAPMTEEEYDARAAEYLRQKETMEKPTIRIAKNMVGRTHACLVSWEALDALSAKESKLLGKPVDYKQPDKDNILAIPELLRAGKEAAQ